MRKLFPSLVRNVPIRSSTMKHLDTFMSSLMVLVGLTAKAMTESLLSCLGRIYHRMHSLLLGDPAKLIKQIKTAQHWYLNIIRGSSMDAPQDFDSADDFFSPRQSAEAAPNTLLWLRKTVLDLWPNDIVFFDRMVYAFLSMHRLIITPPVYDFKTITESTRWERNQGKSPKVEEIYSAIHKLGLNLPDIQALYARKCSSQQHILMHTAGPNGKAGWSSYQDTIALMNSLPVLKALISFAEQSRLNRLINDMQSTTRIPGFTGDTRGGLEIGRIHTFEEWGGKTRHVAIVDYWSQIMLTPLHDTLFDLLKTIPMDATFDQDAASSAICAWTEDDSIELFSVDLSAATDRLPADFQAQVLETLLSNETLATSWKHIMSERKFRTATGEQIQYATGLPMGSKSNWGMLAIVHHIIMQIAATRANVDSYTRYRVCGDDSAMTNAKVYEQYVIIMEALGVPINRDKSVLHVAGLRPAAEFCKRVFVSGVEYTSIPTKLVVKTAMNGRLAPQLQNELSKRGNIVSASIFFHFMAALIDRESLEFLGILNVIPRDLSGLIEQYEPPGALKDVKGWFPRYPVTLDTIKQAYLYVAVTEQLKRLDTLLRQTDLIKTAIDSSTIGYVRPDFNTKVALATGELQDLIEYLGLKVLDLHSDHPVVIAAFIECDRISQMLSALRSGQTDISAQALRNLLDSFRNALIDAWSDDEAARAQADRSLITRTMDTLGLIVNMPLVDANGRPKERRLDFTVMLAYVSRLWTVSWTLGNNVVINSVKSRVTSIPEVAQKTAKAVFDTFSVANRFTRTRQVKDTQSTYVGSQNPSPRPDATIVATPVSTGASKPTS